MWQPFKEKMRIYQRKDKLRQQLYHLITSQNRMFRELFKPIGDFQRKSFHQKIGRLRITQDQILQELIDLTPRQTRKQLEYEKIRSQVQKQLINQADQLTKRQAHQKKKINDPYIQKKLSSILSMDLINPYLPEQKQKMDFLFIKKHNAQSIVVFYNRNTTYQQLLLQFINNQNQKIKISDVLLIHAGTLIIRGKDNNCQWMKISDLQLNNGAIIDVIVQNNQDSHEEFIQKKQYQKVLRLYHQEKEEVKRLKRQLNQLSTQKLDNQLLSKQIKVLKDINVELINQNQEKSEQIKVLQANHMADFNESLKTLILNLKSNRNDVFKMLEPIYDQTKEIQKQYEEQTSFLNTKIKTLEDHIINLKTSEVVKERVETMNCYTLKIRSENKIMKKKALEMVQQSLGKQNANKYRGQSQIY